MTTIEITETGIIVYKDQKGVLLSQNINSNTCVDKHFKDTLDAMKYYNVESLNDIVNL